jgi:hypothetical protein
MKNGIITGTWKKIPKKNSVFIESKYFNKPNEDDLKYFQDSAGIYGEFLNLPVTFI